MMYYYLAWVDTFPNSLNKSIYVTSRPTLFVYSALAAASMETAFTLSTIATSSIEEVANAAPRSLLFFQLYIYRDRDVTRQLVRRAERAGFSGLMLTVDTPFFGKRRADDRNKFTLPAHLKYVEQQFNPFVTAKQS